MVIVLQALVVDAAVLSAAPPDVVLQLRVPEHLAGAEVLRAARLRALGPSTANVTVSVRAAGARSPSGPHSRLVISPGFV